MTVGSSVDICDRIGNVLLTTLSDLKKNTRYIVAVHAATVIGVGPPGANMAGRTNEDSKNYKYYSVSCLIDIE
jgi:hypothetical protein